MKPSAAPTAAQATQAGIAALQRGDVAAARQHFEAAVATGQAELNAWLGLAFSCQSQQLWPRAGEAADAVLAQEPRNLQALIVKGDVLDAQGQFPAAATHYQAALRSAQGLASMPAPLQRELQRVQARCEAYQARFDTHLRQSLAAVGTRTGERSARFEQSLDLLSGRKEIYLQQPKVYYFPGLPQIQFFDNAAFPWLQTLQARYAEIRAELLAVMGQTEGFEPYVQDLPGRPRGVGDGLLNNPDWSAYHLIKNGQVLPEHAARCPRTLAALEGIPLCTMKGRSPSVLFSVLRPGAHIPAHCGLVNTRLICHLPLIVPPDCALRVGNETRSVVEGLPWVFDDTIEHEAWNRSQQTRVVLLFEVWRPELTAYERELVSAMFEAIDAYRGAPAEWGI